MYLHPATDRLRRLLRCVRDRGLLEKQGAGSRTHYTLTSPGEHVDHDTVQAELPLEGGKQESEGGKPGFQGGKRTLPDLPTELSTEMMHGGELAFLFPGSPNHALQACTLPTNKGEGGR